MRSTYCICRPASSGSGDDHTRHAVPLPSRSTTETDAPESGAGSCANTRAGAQALVGALALVPVSLVPAMSPQAGSPGIYSAWALALGAGQVIAATMFLIHRDDRSARRLLRASLLYLICWMGLLLMVAV